MKKEIEHILDTYELDSFNPNDVENVSNLVSKIMSSNAQYDYFKILSIYNEHKKILNLTISEISERSHVPDLTIKRFENLQHMPNALTLISILRAVGLELCAINAIAQNYSEQ